MADTARTLARTLALAALLGGCANLPPPRPLADGQRLICRPGSAIAHRVDLPEAAVAHMLKPLGGCRA
jgi:hypothetical protein